MNPFIMTLYYFSKTLGFYWWNIIWNSGTVVYDMLFGLWSGEGEGSQDHVHDIVVQTCYSLDFLSSLELFLVDGINYPI